MKVSVNWLRELCPNDLSVEEIARRLTAVGLEIEGREDRAAPDNVVAAKVLVRAPIEGSDHLSLCDVDDGTQVWKVVCGAQNYAAGDVVPLARIGAVLPGGLQIKAAKLRGVESNGMLCSGRELGLGDDHSGLLHLPREARPGTPVGQLLGLPDSVLEVNVTPNRPDALSHLGIARELAALLGVPLKTPAPLIGTEPGVARADDASGACAAGAPVHELARIDVESPARCPRYLGRVIEGVKVGPSPLLLQERLRSCGVRSINNVVDATNLALLELGHPLHAFDLDRLHGRRVLVRLARPGEKLVTLDSKERELTADDLLICDGAGPIALGGIMGGKESEVSDGTTRILLESALFEASGIRRSSKRLGLKTEASSRFEKGCSEEMARLAADRCAELIAELSGGRVVPGAIDVWPAPRKATEITVRPARVSAILGTEITATEVESRLSSLGLVPVGGSAAERLWRVPGFRRDLTREIDCIEEVARQRGLDTIPVTRHPAGLGETQQRSAESLALGRMRGLLSARGFHEALNYSFVAERDLREFQPGRSGEGQRFIRVANPLTVEQAAMRTSVLPGLLRNLQQNLARGRADVRLYELGRVYLAEREPRHPEGRLAWPAHEPSRLALVALGAPRPGFWGDPKGSNAAKANLSAAESGFYDLKGALEELCAAAGIAEVSFRPATADEAPQLHPAAAAALLVGGERVGTFGQLHPLVAHAFDVPPLTVVGELAADLLVAHARPVPQSKGLPRFPAVTRDLALVVDVGVPADRLLAEIRAADDRSLLESVELFDMYRGTPVPAGKKSLAFGLVLRAQERTLTDSEADALMKAVVARLAGQLGAEVRG